MTLIRRNIQSILATLCLATLWSVAYSQSEQGGEPDPVFVSPEAQQRISELVADSRIQGSFAQIVATESQLLSDHIELTEIPAPPFGEDKRAQRFAEMLREAGLSDVAVDDVGNVIGRRPGRTGSRVVAYTAHLDTVFPADTDVTVRIEGDTMSAPGVGDNSRGLVVVLGVLRAMQHAEIETDADVLFVGNVGEEGLGDLRGVKHLFREDGPQINTMIVVDGGEIGRIVYGGVGSHRYRVTFRGPGGHSWGAFGTASPHHALGRAIARFLQDAPNVTSSGEKTSFNVGRIGGGISINAIAFESWMEIDMRSGDQAKLDQIDAVLMRTVQEALVEENAARLEGPELTVDVIRVGTRPAARGDPRALLIQNAAASMRELGIEANLQISSTDANYPISIDVPAITMSRGGISENGHSPAESWQDKDSHLALQIGLLTLLAEAGYVR